MRKLEAYLDLAPRKAKVARAPLRPVHRYLVQLPIKLYYTTNFDMFLEYELAEQGVEFDVVANDAMANQHTERRNAQVRKIHGSIKGMWEDVVITRDDYARALQTRPALFHALAEDLKSHVFLFVGYSLRDPDFGAVYNNVFLSMAGTHQTHFLVLLEDPGNHETEDLHRRGLVPVEVWKYAGANKLEKLYSFLQALLEATSDQFHLRRFYRGLERGDQIPIVITSRLHETENYVFNPACDINAANQVQRDLQKLGVVGKVIADEVAVKSPDEFLRDNIVLICSSNRLTKLFFERAHKLSPPLQPQFESGESERFFVAADGRKFVSHDLPSLGTLGDRTEHALIARYHNPWAPNKYIFVFAGLQAIGTHAIADFLARQHSYQALNNPGTEEDLIVMLPITYSEHNPFDYKFTLRDPVSIL